MNWTTEVNHRSGSKRKTRRPVGSSRDNNGSRSLEWYEKAGTSTRRQETSGNSARQENSLQKEQAQVQEDSLSFDRSHKNQEAYLLDVSILTSKSLLYEVTQFVLICYSSSEKNQGIQRFRKGNTRDCQLAI